MPLSATSPESITLDPVQTLLTLAAIVAALAIVIGAVRFAVRFIQRVVHFLDDWQGEEGRAGMPSHPGVMERLATLESRTAQLTPNGGGHMVDAVRRIEQNLAEHLEACPPPTGEEPTPQ